MTRACDDCGKILDFYEFPFDSINLCFDCWERAHGKTLHDKDGRRMEKITNAKNWQTFGSDFNYDKLFEKNRTYKYLKYFKPKKKVGLSQKEVISQENNLFGNKCPLCDSDMILRTGKYGKFYGCSKFPICRGTRKF